MPRDLFPSSADSASPPANIVSSPESKTPAKQEGDSPPQAPEELSRDDDDDDDEDDNNGFRTSEFTIHRDERQLSIQMLRDNRAKADDRNDLHPYVQTLSLSDLDSCVALEEAIFPEQERCTKEKFVYRLTASPELCLGLFSTMSAPASSTSSSSPPPSSQDQPPAEDISSPYPSIPTFRAARPAFSLTPSKRSVLIAMIIATKTSHPYVTDASMEISTYPRRPHSSSASGAASATSPTPSNSHITPPPADPRGHKEDGRTIGMHTFGVLPAFQGRGLGKVLIKSYLQRMEGSGIADRVALISHDELVAMYRAMGFKEEGKSDVKFGGGGWTNLTYDFLDKGLGL